MSYGDNGVVAKLGSYEFLNTSLCRPIDTAHTNRYNKLEFHHAASIWANLPASCLVEKDQLSAILSQNRPGEEEELSLAMAKRFLLKSSV